MKRSDQPFVVGRKTRKGTTLVLLRGTGGAEPSPSRSRPARSALPFPGPWTVRAVVTPAR